MTVLIVAAHPDDEILGCGGTLARHAAAGDTVHILIVAEGAASRAEPCAGRDVEALRAAARNAARVVGAQPPRLLGLPDNRLDSLALLDVIKPIEAALREFAPGTVYTHHGGDLNIDHRIVHEATITACRPLPGGPVRRIYAFETPSSTEWASTAVGEPFKPTRFVDISAHMDSKLAAVACYATEMRPFPHSRSLEAVSALATLRGGQAGLFAAEAFQVILEVDR